MPNRLISLVILSFFFTSNYVYSNESKFLLPKKKPSVFKELRKDVKSVIPLKKPKKKKEVLPLEPDIKPENKKKTEIKKVEKTKKEKQKITEVFVIPQKKPKSYKVVNPAKKSKLLSQKDFEKSKIIFSNIKSGKWNPFLQHHHQLVYLQ